jgi:cytochrome c553
MNKVIAIAATCAFLGSATMVSAAEDVGELVGDASAGKEKSAACAACHGADGNSTNPEWPKLAGQNAGYMVKQLQDFKAGARENASMSPMAAPLSEQDMVDLAAYYSVQEVSVAEADPVLVEQGRQVYQGGNLATGVPACMACHSPNGAGNPGAKFPALAHQHAQYTNMQLQNFRAGARANDGGEMMRNIAAKLSDNEMKAVASYVQGVVK